MGEQSKISYSFGSYLLEVSERRLWRDNTLVSLTPKAFETLVVLVSNGGHVVEKDVLLDRVWTDTFVEEGTLAQNILTLRKTLGTLEDGRQFIETVPRTGYRFIADVKEIIRDDEIIILERRVRTEINAEQNSFCDEDASAEISRENISLKKVFSAWLKHNKTLAVLSVSSIFLVLTLVAFSAWYVLQPEKFSNSKFNKIEVTKLTSEGNIVRAAISPDGKYLVFVKNRGDEYAIFTKQIEGTTAIEIFPFKKQQIIGLSFSPDGNQIFFTTYERNSPSTALMGHLYQMPMLGGTPREIVSDIDSPAAISADGKQIAFIRFFLEDMRASLIVADADGKDEKILATHNLKQSFSASGLAWSPDGKKIACGSYVTGEVGKQMEVLLIDTATGEQEPLSKENWLWIGQIDWLKDGSGVVFPAWNSRSGNSADEIWMVSTDGSARQVSSGINGIFSLNLTADSGALMAIKSDRVTDFWIASAPDFKQSSKIMQNRAEYNRSIPGISWTPDKRIIFGSTFNGNLDIWEMNADGMNRKQLTTDGNADYFPVASSDGQTIIFISNRSGRENLWQMRSDLNKQEQLTNELNVSSPNISPDGKTVYYISLDENTGKYLLRKINPDTGENSQITSMQTIYPRLSPDGKNIACYFPEKTAEGFNENRLKLTILSVENGEILKQFESPFNQNRLSLIEWKGNESISYLTNRGDDTKLWEQPIDGSEARVLVEFPQTSIYRFALSPDGEKLVYEKGITMNDAILINSIK